MLDLLLLIVKCPFNKVKILMGDRALVKIFRLIYRNTHLDAHEAVPIKILPHIDLHHRVTFLIL